MMNIFIAFCMKCFHHVELSLWHHLSFLNTKTFWHRRKIDFFRQICVQPQIILILILWIVIVSIQNCAVSWKFVWTLNGSTLKSFFFVFSQRCKETKFQGKNHNRNVGWGGSMGTGKIIGIFFRQTISYQHYY